MSRTDIKIFIASSGELNEEREKSYKLLADLNKRFKHLHLEAVEFEVDTPSGNNPGYKRIQDAINPLLVDCPIVVVLFYSKAGEFTVEEYKLALQHDKKVYLYLKDGFTPKSPAQGKQYLELLELKEQVEKESALRYQSYKTTEDYYGLLYRDLEKYIEDKYPPPPPPANQPSPVAPPPEVHRAPFIAHPYAIIKNFTGRREELTKLTEWFKFDKEPMYIIEAIGGMGKSALSWRWLQDEIIATDTKVEGIVWWSFYDQGFEDFIHEMYRYCLPAEVRNNGQRVDETTEVIKALVNNRFLLVLDGFERVLRGYAQLMSMYIQEEGLGLINLEEVRQAFDELQRTPVTPKAEKFLRMLCTETAKTKALMTTRLFPTTLEKQSGVKHIKLTGLSKTDTIAFFKAEGITGTDEEMVKAGEIYGFHPLMLKLLTGAISRSFNPSIGKALSSAFTNRLIDQKEPKKILETSYKLLSSEEQKVVSALSVFRTAFKFDAAQALFPDKDGDKLDEILVELRNLGFILYNDELKNFDFHPILRSFLYDGLTSKDDMHARAIVYFEAFPEKEKIVTLEDLQPAIERYHHLVRAGKYDEGCDLYIRRLSDLLFFQLAQYNLCISLCEDLFTSIIPAVPKIKNNSNQSYTLNALGLCYNVIGQLEKGNKIFTNKLQFNYSENNITNLAGSLVNISEFNFMLSCQLTQAIIYDIKAAEVLKEVNDFGEAIAYKALAVILTARGWYDHDNKILQSKTNLQKAIDYFTDEEEDGLSCRVALEYAKWHIGYARDKKDESFLRNAFIWAIKSIEYTENFRKSRYPQLLYFLTTYEATSRVLIAIAYYKLNYLYEKKYIYFYDENFQKINQQVAIESDNYLLLTERCIFEGLTLSRKINRVFNECIFLLLLAQLEWLKITEKEVDIKHFLEVEKTLTETHLLATRIGYRTKLAELHLFCVETLTELQKLHPGYTTTLIGYTAKEHIALAKEFSLDMSTYDGLFLPPDGSADEFYKDIPEYEMLKRGLTDEERITHGYYTVWQRADKLEQELAG